MFHIKQVRSGAPISRVTFRGQINPPEEESLSCLNFCPTRRELIAMFVDKNRALFAPPNSEFVLNRLPVPDELIEIVERDMPIDGDLGDVLGLVHVLACPADQTICFWSHEGWTTEPSAAVIFPASADALALAREKKWLVDDYDNDAKTAPWAAFLMQIRPEDVEKFKRSPPTW